MLPNGNGLLVVVLMLLPYFRIFNPILQGEKFDKEGLYVKKWVPELEKCLINLFINLGNGIKISTSN